MNAALIAALRARIPAIRDRWAALLRIERVDSPLAHPDALAYLMPSTIDQVLTALAETRSPALTLAAAQALPKPDCRCVHNPYVPYFRAGEQALIEALVFAQAERGGLQTRDAELAAVIAALRRIAHEEVETFCAVCSHRCTAGDCRFRPGDGAAAEQSSPDRADR